MRKYKTGYHKIGPAIHSSLHPSVRPSEPKSQHPRAPLGEGGRFAALKGKLSHQSGVTNPGALAAYIGRKKYGAAKMGKMAAAGRK